MKKILELEFSNPSELNPLDGVDVEIWNEFFVPVYDLLYAELDENIRTYPHIDFDKLKGDIDSLLGTLDTLSILYLRKFSDGATIAKSEWVKKPASHALNVFFGIYPDFACCMQNISLLADIAIKMSEKALRQEITSTNFMVAKKFIDRNNRECWSRRKTPSEEQSGVSNLGQTSELLLVKALLDLLDENNLFQTHNPNIQSYGDFVLMCLPNNLWLSVKSNFARERLLASGYTTDILGVGFFTDHREFTSKSKIRNFQRVGFLAMYLPDEPVSERQIEENKNTYREVVDWYSDEEDRLLPLNINGTDFIRPISQLGTDLKALIEKELRNRTTLGF